MTALSQPFYGQRCGMAVNLAPDFPEYHYPACHTDLVQFHASLGREGQVECGGGWHDAGDFGRHIVNSGITTGSLAALAIPCVSLLSNVRSICCHSSAEWVRGGLLRIWSSTAMRRGALPDSGTMRATASPPSLAMTTSSPCDERVINSAN